MLVYDRLVAKLGQIGAALLVAAVAVGVLLCGYLAVRHFFLGGIKTEVKLGKNQTNAAILSGQDAVETIGNRSAADEADRRNVEETKNDIQRQTDASGVTDAGRNGLCRLASHRSKPECMLHAPAK